MITISEAVDRLLAGEVVLVPTETVYGMAADAQNPLAVQRLLTLKGARGNKPLPVQVPDLQRAQMVGEFNADAIWLAERGWPGPLTLVVPATVRLAPAVLAGGSSVGLRCPSHPIMLEILRAFNGPLAVPSANRSGAPPPHSSSEASSAFNGHLPFVEGANSSGRPSTVIQVGPPAVLLREGPHDALLATLPSAT